MTEYCVERLGNYFEEYIDIKPGYSLCSEQAIRQSIECLIKNGIFDPKGLQRDILRKANVLLSMDYIASSCRGNKYGP